MDEIEAGGVPVIMLRGEGQINPDGVRDYDLLVPATVEALVLERHATARDAYQRAPMRGARPSSASDGADRPPGTVRALLQRVDAAEVRVDGEIVGAIGRAWWSCWASARTTTTRRADELARADRRAADLPGRRGADEPLAARHRRRGCLVVSQFTLYADTRAAGGPGSPDAAPPELAERLLRGFVAALRALGVAVATGRFGAEMEVELVNDGPFTIWLDTRRARGHDGPAVGDGRSATASRRRPARLLGRLEQRPAAAGADERLLGRALLVDDERLEVRLHAAVGSDAVHPRRLRVEPAHRCLAADRAGAGHAWSSGVEVETGCARRDRARAGR